MTVVPPPAITSFTAGASTITAGNSTTLTGVFSGGTGTVSPGVGAVTSGMAVTVTPATTTTYTLTVTNSAGTSVTATATVTVVPPPTITSFTAGAVAITPGNSTTLTPAFSNGTGSIDNNIGPVTSGPAVTVTPASTTTYTLTVTNAAQTSVTAAVTVAVGVPTYTQLQPTTSPNPGCCFGMAFDPVSNSTLLFGGVQASPNPYSTLGDTWQLQGGQWTKLSLNISPPAREGPGMAFDGATNTVVMFGGSSGLFGDCCDLNDTWIWNGAASTWTQITTPGPPGRRFDGDGMAYDPATKKVVLFGGNTQGNTTYLGDTWTWDGVAQTWTPMSPATSPSARAGHGMATDAAGNVVVFGGTDSATMTNLGDTWVWNGTTWQQLFPATAPPTRSGHSMAFDADLNEVVLFGGYGLNDTWTWDGSNWTQLSPATAPPQRYSFGMDYDGAAHAVVIFGGFTANGPAINDTWQLGLAVPPPQPSYTQLQPASSPGQRCCMGMVFVPQDAAGHTNYTLLFDGGSSGDTWQYQSGNWTQLNPATSPPARSGPGMAYDVATKTVVLFGGTSGGDMNDTWIWDGTNWTQANPSPAPPGRRFDTQGMAYLPSSGTVVMFGGVTQGGVMFGDTWTWNGVNQAWTLQTPASSPPARRAPLAYDPSTGKVLLFGGEGSYSGPTYGDTWLWDGGNWTQQSPATSPPARSMASLAYDSALGKLVLFGGSNAGSNGPYFTDTWSWNGSTWTQLNPTGGPPPERYAFGMAYDPSQGVLIYGGLDLNDSVTLSDMWLLTP